MTTDRLNKLTPEQKRIKIAEACGWRRESSPIISGVSVWISPSHLYCGRVDDPRNGPGDYLNDLNAALTLCDALAEKGWRCHIDNGLDKTWECTFEHSTELDGMAGCPLFLYAPADTLAAAISHAFLLTVG